MATDLALPGGLVPSNLHLPPSVKATLVASDMYDLANRVKAISPRLHIWLLTEEDDPRYAYVITEHCEDGVERMVFKVRELDGRVVKKLEYLMSRSLPERLHEIERDNHRFEAEEKERQLEELYENVGRPMWTELERCGFITRPVSYPKVGVTSRGRRAR